MNQVWNDSVFQVCKQERIAKELRVGDIQRPKIGLRRLSIGFEMFQIKRWLLNAGQSRGANEGFSQKLIVKHGQVYRVYLFQAANRLREILFQANHFTP
ncbi:hypothetical protein SDC9_137288 [bioreactor metagenome]|uniref:Uncharacterized protein n=1 Tax=bioreactor metagenome TaxID=1076179 RepID=A0A645DLQ2_9ZZZZ